MLFIITLDVYFVSLIYEKKITNAVANITNPFGSQSRHIIIHKEKIIMT
jgi:hypothetical protein